MKNSPPPLPTCDHVRNLGFGVTFLVSWVSVAYVSQKIITGMYLVLRGARTIFVSDVYVIFSWLKFFGCIASLFVGMPDLEWIVQRGYSGLCLAGVAVSVIFWLCAYTYEHTLKAYFFATLLL